jgi:hypothetical protein
VSGDDLGRVTEAGEVDAQIPLQERKREEQRFRSDVVMIPDRTVSGFLDLIGGRLRLAPSSIHQTVLNRF